MRSLVTGATGFIGSHVAELLKERGHDVRLLVRNEKRLYPELQTGYEIIRGDVTQPAAELAKAVQGVDYIFHVAGLIKGRTQAEFTRVNAHGTRNLLEAARAHKGELMRFLHCSSLAAVGPCEDSSDVITEERYPHPVTYYGRSKLLAEKYCEQAMPELPITIIRPPAVYGPRDTGILEFFTWMAKGYSLQFGKEERVFSMVHGRDLARGMIEAALHDGTVGETYFVTDEQPYSMSWTMEALRSVLKPSKNKTLSPPVWLAKAFARMNDVIQVITRKAMLPNSDKMRELLPLYWVCSGQKAREGFGYRSQIPFIEGLKQTAAWYTEHRWIKVK
jgi:nucleoside-diphosphate-sugar epimerase